ncbi:proprotein convertase subtilisin/kexin type 7-like [Mytilus californianus]|uniref:proprotein convertase subtilisin/kexin type 7-like n=1 Tax=Mytilus californianus TaxID=6549 RepID=UPI002245D9F7|nr:proprotein convertase subtilisin/kexin type 7-like [Mytilus californianus]XP_052060000.1 proprotein convertase subtilisin/kexin type 7-like [Mytilus californianus]
MHNGEKILLLLLLSLTCCLFDKPAERKKQIPFAPHTDNYKDTLLWTIELKHNKSEHVEQIPGHSHDHQDDLYRFGNIYIQSEGQTESDRNLARKVAPECNLTFLGHIGQLKNIYLFGHVLSQYTEQNTTNQFIYVDFKTLKSVIDDIETKLDNHDNVVWFHREKVFSREKRRIQFSDPAYNKQWHLNNPVSGMDINVTGVWEHNITGLGITVSVVDDGLEWTNADITENYSKEGSYDLNSNDDDPMPDGRVANNHHGTRCAGEIAAVVNNYCAVGVAYKAKVSGIRILDGPMTDSLEAKGFNERIQVNDIYSCSWGPDDDGKTVDGPHFMAAKAIRYGIDFGRKGYGSIYVVASGNGGRFYDNCNYDGYANSIYTVTIGAVDENGNMPYYAEECASMLAVTFSSGMGTRSIVTTDWNKHGASGCTYSHTGTSAAAPIAAGMVALMLQARPCLTWRDVQYIIVMTAQKVDIDLAHWQKNKAGLYHSHKHGFGLMKAWRLVNAARVWEPVPWLTSYMHSSGDINVQIPKGVNKPLTIKYTVSKADIEGFDLFTLENAQLAVTITHPTRGDLETVLLCPSGTRSIMGAYRMYDRSDKGLSDWTFNTVRCWGESPVGEWVIKISDKGRDFSSIGYLKRWKLRLFGTSMSTDMFQQRRSIIEEAMSGQYLNQSYIPECQELPNTAKPDSTAMSEKTLKILTLASAFCVVLAIYQSFEYIFCYDEEKKLVSRMRKVYVRAQQLSQGNDPSETTGLLSSAQDTTGSNTDLWEEYPMQELSSTISEEQADGDQYYNLRVALPQQGVYTERHSSFQNSNDQVPSDLHVAATDGACHSSGHALSDNSVERESFKCNDTNHIEPDLNSIHKCANQSENPQKPHCAINKLPTISDTSLSDDENVIYSQVLVNSSHSDEEHAHLISSKST